ncbi:MAG: site-specific integrase [Pseudomonadales bacterium]|nr:site-specific integrase [Pseudomonadales bacterium]
MLSSTLLRSNVTRDNTGITLSIPVIITKYGILKSYLDYLIVNRNKSESWKDRSAFSLRLLIDYIGQNEDCFKTPREMFTAFSDALFTGTIGTDGEDLSGLRWIPRNENDAASLIGYITQYTDWLAIKNDRSELQLNPYRESTNYEDRLNYAAYLHKKNNAFMSHLWADKSPTQSSTRNYTRNKKPSHTGHDEAKAFPQGRINDLLNQGFVRAGFSNSTIPHERLNLRNILITVLMHYGGLRVSECFHIFVDDIAKIKDKGFEFVVKVYHPANGTAPDGSSRREYLLKKYNLQPRTEYPRSHKLHSGWKNPLLTDSKDEFFTVLWFPASAGELFYELWKMYLLKQRVHSADHPYAFTNRNGHPYTRASFKAANKRAVERIGLTYSKEACTTEHSHRHSLGRRLSESGASELIIRGVLHHKSLESQITYTAPSERETRNALKELDLKLNNPPLTLP